MKGGQTIENNPKVIAIQKISFVAVISLEHSKMCQKLIPDLFTLSEDPNSKYYRCGGQWAIHFQMRFIVKDYQRDKQVFWRMIESIFSQLVLISTIYISGNIL